MLLHSCSSRARSLDAEAAALQKQRVTALKLERRAPRNATERRLLFLTRDSCLRLSERVRRISGDLSDELLSIRLLQVEPLLLLLRCVCFQKHFLSLFSRKENEGIA